MLRYFCSANLWLLFSLLLILGKSDNEKSGSSYNYTFFGVGSGLDNATYNSLVVVGLAAALGSAVLAVVTRRSGGRDNPPSL